MPVLVSIPLIGPMPVKRRLLTGLATVSVGSAIVRAEELSRPVRFSWAGAAVLAAFATAFFGIWWFNQRIANKLQRYIDEIDVLTGGTE